MVFALCGFDLLRSARELREPTTRAALRRLEATGAALFVVDGNALVNR